MCECNKCLFANVYLASYTHWEDCKGFSLSVGCMWGGKSEYTSVCSNIWNSLSFQPQAHPPEFLLRYFNYYIIESSIMVISTQPVLEDVSHNIPVSKPIIVQLHCRGWKVGCWGRNIVSRNNIGSNHNMLLPPLSRLSTPCFHSITSVPKRKLGKQQCIWPVCFQFTAPFEFHSCQCLLTNFEGICSLGIADLFIKWV